MQAGDDASARAEALAALRERLREVLGSRGYTRKDIVRRSGASRIPLSATTISQALNDRHPAPTLRTVTGIAQAAEADPETYRQLRELWHRSRPGPDVAAPAPCTDVSAGPGSVRLAGPALLQVQQAPFLTAGPVTAFLTPYYARPHDIDLERLLAPALDGKTSCFVLLTGDSSTGKTRALFEVLLRLAPHRRLWRPTHAAALADLLGDGLVAPGDVLWLNEAQRFLQGDRAEEAAAALRELLLTRPGVVVVGTLWTIPYWEEFVRPPESVGAPSHVRALLEAPVTHRIAVPAELSEAQHAEWQSLARSSGDPRMGQAGRAGAADGRVVQHLSGGPELLAAYRMGPGAHFTPAEHALITAAIAVRHAGRRVPLSEALLAHIADAALPARLRPAQPGWADEALTALVTGARTNGRRTDIRNSLTALFALRDTAGGPTTYEPADYLQQNAAEAAAAVVPQSALWDAVTAFTTDSAVLMSLSYEAERQGFVKQAVVLVRRATTAGYPTRWDTLLSTMPVEAREREEMALWIASHTWWKSGWDMCTRLLELVGEGNEATLCLAKRSVEAVDVSDAKEVTHLLRTLRNLGHESLLIDRDPAGLVRLSDVDRVSDILGQLLEYGYTAHAARLARRIVADCASLVHPHMMLVLAEAHRLCPPWCEDGKALFSAAASRVDLSGDVEPLLSLVEELKKEHPEAAHLLALRLADAIDLRDTEFVASSLYELRELAMTAASRRLAEQAVPVVELEEPEAVGWLLDELRLCGFNDLVTELLGRDPVAGLDVGSVKSVVVLLWALQSLERDDLVRRLLLDNVRYVEFDDAEYTASYLDELVRVGSPQVVRRFALRAADEVPPSHAAGLRFLARSLDRAGQPGALDRLARRAVLAVGPYGHGFVPLLRVLREHGLAAHADTLIERAITHGDLPHAVRSTEFLPSLRAAGENEAADRLESAVPPPVAAAPDPVEPRKASPYGRETDGTPAAPWTWSDLDAVEARLASRTRGRTAATPGTSPAASATPR
ncbi:hypothetical protein [Streptomyces sp. SID7909]|uniref:hypothetical protein n=1 Tax=Streptomyces sp. SID7909 TaxID=2706092 RepID=UPI0013BE81B4|nr:hypothetical protein [Streptomyces sp. SID7909]NEC09546.1 hypothetical protein [Streptomyces sp. SID7909]